MAVSPSLVELANFLIPAAIFATMALALNLQWGHTGLFNGGVAAFWAIGAYTAAILMTGPAPPSPQYPGHLGGYSQHFLVAAVVAMLLSAIIGLLIAFPLLRLRADYFAIATLALAEIVRLFLINAQSLTAGTIGIILIPRPLDVFAGGDPGVSDVSMAALAGMVLLLVFIATEYVTRAPWGRVLRGIREDEEATLALGKNVFWYRLQAFVLGSAIMGLGGAVYAPFIRFISPSQFDPLATFTIYVMVILGGSGRNVGVVFGAFLFYSFDWMSVRAKDFFPTATIGDALYVPVGPILAAAAMFLAYVLVLRKPRPRRERILYAGILGALVSLPVVVAELSRTGVWRLPALAIPLQEKIPPLRLMIIGALLVALVVYRPEGLLRERKRTYPPVTRP